MSVKADSAQQVQEKTERGEQAHEPISQWVTFRLASEAYGISVMQVREVLRVTEIAPVPGAPEFVVGILNLRGNVVTVVDTRKRFGLPPRAIDDATRIVIIESGDDVVGMVVDRVAEVITLKASQIETTPNVGNDESAKYLHGVANVNGTLLILVDHEKFLGQRAAPSPEPLAAEL